MSKVPTKKKSFRYKQLEIYKSLALGRGSYGAVYKAKCDQLMCAAKILHDELINKKNAGVDAAIERFEQECEFLSGFRHPNIVQYLGTARCPERSKLPILMMELVNENLTTMLENAKHPLPFYLEVDICHDIALAIAYLHSNDIIHRDLSSNNVLITAGKRAKVTDFGMSRLVKKSDSPPILTQCPGTMVYMPPEALKEPPDYTERLDCFSAGVLMIQVCSRQTPTRGERQTHERMIRKMHPLLPIAKICLSDNQYERPLAEDLCQRLAILQDGAEYKLSLLPSNADPKDVAELERQNKLLHKRLDQQDQQTKENDNIIREIRQDNEALQLRVNQLIQQQGPGSVGGPTKSKQRWVPGRNLPTEMVRGSVAVDGDVAYFMNSDGTLFSFDSTIDPYEAWCQLVKCPLEDSCLAIVDGLLTAIGGLEWKGMGNRMTNKLISLKGQEIRTWMSHFPPMPTKRRLATAVTTTKHLIVIGGISKVGIIKSLDAIDKVEVLNTAASPLTWTEVARLSHPYFKVSATICGNQLYVLGGMAHKGATKLVLACSLNNLLLSNKGTEPNSIWRQPTSVPHYFATCVSINDELLAVGGASDGKSPQAKTEVYRYDQTEGSWNLFTNMITARYNSLVGVFPTKNMMVVVGGMDQSTSRDITELCYM